MSEEVRFNKTCPDCGTDNGAIRVVTIDRTEASCWNCGFGIFHMTFEKCSEAWNRRDTTSVQQEREECAKVLDGFEQEFLSRAEESIQRNNPASARFEKSRALELKSYAAAIRRRGE